MKCLSIVLSLLFVPGVAAAATEPNAHAMAAHSMSAHPAKHAGARAMKKPMGPKTVVLPDGLKYVDTVVGKGAEAKDGQKVRVHYTGTLTSGLKFDSSRDRNEPFEFTLGAGQVIKGWDEGVKGMKIGGKRSLTIPSTLGYGAQGAGGAIPPNATLLFDIELLGLS